jgi:hypothetical protein
MTIWCNTVSNKNGYINATKLCQAGNNRLFKWNQNKQSKILEKEISSLLNIDVDVDDLKYVIRGGTNTIRGTFVHPLLITPIACWIFPTFTFNVSVWIEEWKKYSKNNNLKYWNTLATCKPLHNNDPEKQIQIKLQKLYGGEIEVDTKYGYIDLLTETKIIEIKKYDRWKYALGQILAYSDEYQEHQKIIYLFNVPKNEDMTHIKKICDKYNVIIEIDDG